MGVHLDRVLQLAGSHVGGYSRIEGGREEYVEPYERMLRDLAGGVPGKGMGRLAPHDYPNALDDLHVQLRPDEEKAVQDHIEQAHKAFTSGDYMAAHYHLGMARQTAASSDYNAGYLRRVLTEAQAHMSLREQGEAGEGSGEYPAKPAGGASVLARVLDFPGTPEGHNTGPGGIVWHNTGPGAIVPVQADLAEPVVRWMERRQDRREARQKAKAQKAPRLPRRMV